MPHSWKPGPFQPGNSSSFLLGVGPFISHGACGGPLLDFDVIWGERGVSGGWAIREGAAEVGVGVGQAQEGMWEHRVDPRGVNPPPGGHTFPRGAEVGRGLPSPLLSTSS